MCELGLHWKIWKNVGLEEVGGRSMDGAADGAKKEQTFGETTVSSLYDIYSSFSLCNLLVLYFYSD